MEACLRDVILINSLIPKSSPFRITNQEGFDMTRNRTALGACLVICSTVAAAQQTTITEFHVPTLNSAPTGITASADGNLWFTERSANKVARMTPAGAFTEYAVPTASSAPEAITATPDGYLWFTEHNGHKIGRISQYGGAISEFAVPGVGAFPTAIATDHNGKVWFASSQQPNVARVGSISPTGVVTLLPTAATQTYISALTAGPDGNLWVTQISSTWGDSVAKVTTAGWGSFTNYRLPNHGAGPENIAVGPDNNLWFTESNDDKIGRITTTGLMVEFTLTAGSKPQQIVGGADGNLWFTEPGSNRIGKMTTWGQPTDFPVPTGASMPFGIARDLDGHLYFTEQSANQVGKM
jgi:virginiamycin B lyase